MTIVPTVHAVVYVLSPISYRTPFSLSALLGRDCSTRDDLQAAGLRSSTIGHEVVIDIVLGGAHPCSDVHSNSESLLVVRDQAWWGILASSTD